MRTRHFFAVLASFAAVAILAADASAMYHPTMGRFLQRDPGPGEMMTAPRVGTGGPAIGGGFLPRDPTEQYRDGMNLVEYVGSNPVGRVDPYGNVWWNPFTWFSSDDKKEDSSAAEDAAKGAAQGAAEAAQEAAKNYSEEGKLNLNKEVTPTVGQRLNGLARSAGWTVVDAMKGGLETFAKSAACNQWYLDAANAIKAAGDPKTICNPCDIIIKGSQVGKEYPKQTGNAGRCQFDLLIGTGGLSITPGAVASQSFALFAQNLYKKCNELFEKTHPGAKK